MRSFLKRRMGNALGPTAPSAVHLSQVEAVLGSILFDNEFYARQSGIEGRIEGALHYVSSGGMQGLDPHTLFSSSWYLESYDDVRRSRMNPLAHYLARGAAEGRSPHPLFQSLDGERRDQDLNMSQLSVVEYLSDPGLWGSSIGLLDGRWYLHAYPDVSDAGISPFEHFVLYGESEGRLPNPYFDPHFYVRVNADVANYRWGPSAHFLNQGRYERRNFSPFVDREWVAARFSLPSNSDIHSTVTQISTHAGIPPSVSEELLLVLRPALVSTNSRNPVGRIRFEVLSTRAVVWSSDDGLEINFQTDTEDLPSHVDNADVNTTYDVKEEQGRFVVTLAGPWVLDAAWVLGAHELAEVRPSIPQVLNERLAALAARQASLLPWVEGLERRSTELSLCSQEDFRVGLAGTDLSAKVLTRSCARRQQLRDVGGARLVLISHESSLTGAPIFLEQVGTELRKLGAHVSVVSLRDDLSSRVFVREQLDATLLSDIDGSPGVSIDENWILTSLGRSRLSSFLAGMRPDLAILSTVNSASCAEALVRAGVPYIMLVHENTGLGPWSATPFDHFGHSVIRAMRCASRVVFGSEATRRTWSPHEGSSVVVPSRRRSMPAADGRKSPSRLRAALGISEESTVFLFVGTFEERKRPQDAISAFASAGIADAHLLMVGATGGDSETERLVTQIASDQEKVHVYAGTDDLLAFYEAADCLVFTSERETFPLVIQEAALCRVDVISSRYDGWEEVFPSNEILNFEPGDIEHLADLMVRVATDPAASQARAEELFLSARSAWERTSRALREVVELALRSADLIVAPRGWVSSE